MVEYDSTAIVGGADGQRLQLPRPWRDRGRPVAVGRRAAPGWRCRPARRRRRPSASTARPRQRRRMPNAETGKIVPATSADFNSNYKRPIAYQQPALGALWRQVHVLSPGNHHHEPHWKSNARCRRRGLRRVAGLLRQAAGAGVPGLHWPVRQQHLQLHRHHEEDGGHGQLLGSQGDGGRHDPLAAAATPASRPWPCGPRP